MSQLLLQQYLNQLRDVHRVSGTHRESMVREAFKDLLRAGRVIEVELDFLTLGLSGVFVRLVPTQMETKLIFKYEREGDILYINQTLVRLTSPRAGDITPARKKGGLNFLYIMFSQPGR